MVLRQEELITNYFEHRMSSGEEQDFLIKLASSDSLRLAFRSHLELMTAVRKDKDDLRSVAQVRNRTLTALGLSAAALTPFIEQELVRSAKTPQEASIIPSASWLSKLPHFLRTRPFALGTGLMLGFAASSVLLNTNPAMNGSHQVSNSNSHVQAVPASVPQTQSSAPNAGISAIATPETNTAAHRLNSTSHSGASVEPSVPAVRTSVATHSSVIYSAPRTEPVVTASRPGRMSTSRVHIQKTNDSAKAK